MKSLLYILSLFSFSVFGQPTGVANAWHFPGGVSITGDLTYGFIHCVYNISGATYTPALTQNVPLKITSTLALVENDGITFAGDTFTVPSGDYSIKVFADISSANNDDFKIDCRTNNVAMVSSWQGTTTGATNYTSISYEWYGHALAINTKISFYITNLTNNNDPVIRRFKVIIEKKPENP